MPKLGFSSHDTAGGRFEEKATEAQIRRLMFLLGQEGEFDGLPRDDEYRHDAACMWVWEAISVRVVRLEELTKGQIGQCFRELE